MRGFHDGEYQDGEVRGCGFVAGIRGMGKTTEMARLCNQCLGGALFFDPLSRHESALSGYRLISQPGRLVEYLQVNRARRFRILYQPRTGELDQHFHSVCTVVRAFGWMLFAIDELDMLCGPRYGDTRMTPAMYHLVNYGRHCRVAILATARRPMNVPRGFTSQCLSMRLFQMRERADLRYFEEYIGETDARRLSSLPKFQYLHWTGDGPAAQMQAGQLVKLTRLAV